MVFWAEIGLELRVEWRSARQTSLRWDMLFTIFGSEFRVEWRAAKPRLEVRKKNQKKKRMLPARDCSFSIHKARESMVQGFRCKE